MLIVLKKIRHPIYNYINDIVERKYNIKSNDTEDILVNGIPINYKGDNYVIINFANIEISGLEFSNKIYGLEYILSEDIYGEIIISNTLSVHDIPLNYIPKVGDCYYDEHLNIMFVKFQDIRIEYIDISNYKLNLNNFVNLNFEWINKDLENNQIRINEHKIFFEKKFINLPEIPLIISTIEKNYYDDNFEIIPLTGAKVFDIENNLIGIVSYSNEESIFTIPIFLISRMIEYLNDRPMILLNFNYNSVKINYLNGDIDYGLFYEKNKKNKKFIDEIEKSYIILKIDNYKIDNKKMIDYYDLKLPLSTYIWLYAKNKVKIYGTNIITKSQRTSDTGFTINLKENEILRFYNYDLKLDIVNDTVLSVSKLEFVNYKDKYMIELNEKIMQLLKKIIQTTNDYDYLYDYIIKNKFSKNKIIIIINKRLDIKIVKKIKEISIKNINTIVTMFKTNKSLGTFIENY